MKREDILPPAPIYVHLAEFAGTTMATTVSPYRGPETRFDRGYWIKLQDISDGECHLVHEEICQTAYFAQVEVHRCTGCDFPDLVKLERELERLRGVA